MLEKLYKPLTDLFLNRYPIKLVASAGREPPTVVLAVTNQTPNLPVFIHDVRVHFGFKERSRAFSLVPHSTVELRPKETKEWYLSFEPSETKIVVRYLSTDLMVAGTSSGPGIESPAQLFNAIGMNPKKHSWVEVDFNEYEQRRFLHGTIQGVFDMVGKITSARRKQKNPLHKKATLLLPTGIEIELEESTLTLGELIAVARQVLDDEIITPETFGVAKRFFFVNSSTGSLIDSHLDLSRPLSTLFDEDGNVIELRYCHPPHQPDGSVLNPMRGVTKFIK